MQLYQHFDQLIYDANALPVPRDAKEPLIAILQFLRTQTLCDLDRRAKRSDHKEAWTRVEWHFKQLGFRERFNKPDDFYDPIFRFVGYGKHEEKYHPPKPYKPTPSPYAEWTPEQMLAEMLKDTSGILKPLEKITMREHLTYLIEQAKRPRWERQRNEIKTVWRELHPMLKRYGLLKKFEADPMKGKLLFFLKGGF